MRDTLYLAGIVAFFALMLAFVRGLEALGHTDQKSPAMNTESVIAGVVALALLVYLVYTLLRPERF